MLFLKNIDVLSRRKVTIEEGSGGPPQMLNIEKHRDSGNVAEGGLWTPAAWPWYGTTRSATKEIIKYTHAFVSPW